MIDSSAPLSVETDLALAVNGAEASVESTGDRLFVGFGSIADAARALRHQPDRTDALSAALAAADLTVEVRVRDRTVAVAGAGARPGPVSRFLGVDPIEARIGGGLGAVRAEVAAAARAARETFEGA